MRTEEAILMVQRKKNNRMAKKLDFKFYLVLLDLFYPPVTRKVPRRYPIFEILSWVSRTCWVSLTIDTWYVSMRPDGRSVDGMGFLWSDLAGNLGG